MINTGGWKFTDLAGRLLGLLADRVASERKEITRGWSADRYLTRWVLAGKSIDSTFLGGKAVFLHWFHRSDADEMHDHPWPFVSVIVSGGYWEKTPDYAGGWSNGVGPTKLRWHGPGRVLFRPANWIHSVIIPDGQEAVTLILRGNKQRSWGFWCPAGYRPWRDHAAAAKRTGDGCG